MEHTLFHVLLIFNAFCTAMENPIASTSYRFKVYPVENCPMNNSAYEEAAIKMNCSQDTRYLCAPDRNLSNLIEFCTDVRKSLFGPDNCVRLEGTGNLNHYKCEEFSSGCPSTPYFDDEIYRYPACLSINVDLNCFVAETNCTERLVNTTTLDMGLNNSKSEDSTSQMETNTSEPHSNMNKIIISVVYVVVIVTVVIGIIGFAFYKRLCKNTGRTKMQLNKKKLNDFLSKEEFTVRHVRFILVGCGGAGKTTLLKRLQNAKFKDLKNIETTELVDVHVNIFDVLENEKTIQGVNTKNKKPLITFPPNVTGKNDTMPQLHEPPFTAEQLKKGNDQSESGYDEISERESLNDDFQSMDERENEETEFLNGAEEQIKLKQLASRHTPLNEENKPNHILEKNKSNNYTNPFLDDSAKDAFSKIIDAVEELSSDDHLCPRITFLDFAGQSIYYAFQQIYFSPKTCYILVVDMTKKLNEQVHETDYRCCSLFESWTYKDYYKFWFKLIDSYSGTNSPVILVGTHAENLSKQDSEIFFRGFHASFEDHPDIPRHLNKERNFAIGFPEKGSKLADLKEIKTCIANIVNLQGCSDQIQPVWALFEHIMQEEKRRRIMPRKTLSNYNDELSKEYRLNDENITEMLLFLHRVGNLLYFDEDILRETIILDVQWFVNAFKSIFKYHENIACSDHNSSRFKTTGEITDQELTDIWESNEEGQTYIYHKKEVLQYMEHFGLVAICDAQKGTLPFYYFPSMNKKKFENQSKHFIKSSILCFQFNEDGQLPFNIFYRLVVKCLKIPEWSISQENKKNCLYENVACFSYRHYIVVVCLCKFQIQLQIWNPEKNGHIEQELLGNIQRPVEETLRKRKYLYKIGYKCKNGKLNAEKDNSFIAQTKFPVSKLNCPTCALENKHLVENQICWVYPRQSECTSTMYEENETGQLSKTEYANINLCIEGVAFPLYKACEDGHFDTVKLLLRNGADINLCSASGTSPLYIACRYGHNAIVHLLLRKGADINFCSNDGTSPLHIACQYKHEITVQLLLRNGADINSLDDSGASPLYIACRYGHTDTVHFLLREGADINICSYDGASPIYTACQYGHDHTVQLLLNNGANVNLRSVSGTSPLFIACRYGHIAIVELLLSKGADINFCSNVGTSPLHIACQYKHDLTVQILLKNGADINLLDDSGASPVYIACRYGHTDIVHLLLSEGADINLCSNDKTSPLHIACQYKHDLTVQLLLNNGADIN